MPDTVSRPPGPLQRLLPRSLLGRVMLLYSATLVLLVALGCGAFLAYEVRSKLDDAEQGAMAMSALVGPAVSEAAVIGDYDTIKRTLERSIEHPLFEGAAFIDLKGARLEVRRQDRPDPVPPRWLAQRVADRLDVVNSNIIVGGRDYGITRLTVWSERIAADIWQVMRLSAVLALAGVVLGAGLVWWPLKRWLGQLGRLEAFGELLQGGAAPGRVQADEAPLEFQRTFAVLNRVAASLQVERAQAAVTLASIAEGVATLNLDGEIVLANPRLGQLLQRPSAQLLGLKLAQLLPELGFAAQPGETWRDRRVRVGAETDPAEQARVLEASLARVDAESGEAAGWVLALRDVSQQQALEDQLRAELASRANAMRAMSEMLGSSGSAPTAGQTSTIEQLSLQVGDLVARLQHQADQLDAIFNLTPDGFVSFDDQGRAQFVSPAVPFLTGLSSRALLEQDEAGIEALLSGRQADAETQRPLRLAELIEEPRVLRLARPMPRILMLALHEGGGREVAKVLHLRDVTQQYALDQLKSEFLTMAAHELRTPMTSIFGFTELLIHRELPAPQRQELLARIHRQSRAMMDILDELLDLARIESRRAQDFVFAPVELGGLLRETAGDFQPPESREPLQLQLPECPLWVHVDASKLSQALRNVLSNAYKYSPGGGSVVLRLVPVGDSHVDIEVQDQGMGMNDDELERVTERFFRADKSGAIPGTGLGMALVKEIVELLGGSLLLRSQPGVGTTVSLRLARAEPPAEPA
jgi:signal transduction histidine kinase